VDPPKLETLIKENKMEARALLKQPATLALLHFLSHDRSSMEMLMVGMAKGFGDSIVQLSVCLSIVLIVLASPRAQ
jgi:hypothetical protein